jgi:flavin-dependent dehydrogenase
VDTRPDIVVVGGGPAGAAAAITAAHRGARVTVLEAARFPRFRPGETLSTSALQMVERLIGADALADLPKLAYRRILRDASRAEGAQSDQRGDPGAHIERRVLDAALLQAADMAGCRVLQPVQATHIEVRKDSVIVHTPIGRIECRFVIDASGSVQWLSRRLQRPCLAFSDRLRVHYQYFATRSAMPDPQFSFDPLGWTWRTDLPRQVTLAATLGFSGQSRDMPILGQTLGAVRHADCTWRIADQLASSRYAIVGDAACHVDPASSRGMLRALASGVGAADAAMSQLSADAIDDDPLLRYCRSMTSWFLEDCRMLNAHYQRATSHGDPVGFGRLSSAIFSEGTA